MQVTAAKRVSASCATPAEHQAKRTDDVIVPQVLAFYRRALLRKRSTQRVRRRRRRSYAEAHARALDGELRLQARQRFQRLLLGGALGVQRHVRVLERALQDAGRVGAPGGRIDALVHQHLHHVARQRLGAAAPLKVADLQLASLENLGCGGRRSRERRTQRPRAVQRRTSTLIFSSSAVPNTFCRSSLLASTPCAAERRVRAARKRRPRDVREAGLPRALDTLE